jgi:hypothetical protein
MSSTEPALVKEIRDVLEDFRPISLEEMEASHLMSRFDEKYVFHLSKLKDFLRQLNADYRVLSIRHRLLAIYENLYFDTPDLRSYHDHHNGKAARFKIRFRRYRDSGDCYFEVKMKDNRGLTHKERMTANEISRELSPAQLTFADRVLKQPRVILNPSLSNSFYRITLVNTANRERVTLDLLIRFQNLSRQKSLDHIVISEVKQERHFYESAFKKLMQQERIFPISISKYCVGTLLTHPGIKYNRFKPKLTLLNKLSNELV